MARLRWRGRQLAKLLVFALVVHVFVIPQIGGARKALSTIGSVDLRLIVAAMVLEALALLAYARLTPLLLDGGEPCRCRWACDHGNGQLPALRARRRSRQRTRLRSRYPGHRLGRGAQRAVVDGVDAMLLRLGDQLADLVADRRRLRLVTGLATANWLLDAAALWVALTAFGPSPGVVGLMVAYGLANVMATIPISPGGLGVIEAVLIPTLVCFGTPRAPASIGVVAYRLVNFWLPIPVGAAAYVAVQRTTGVPATDRALIAAEE